MTNLIKCGRRFISIIDLYYRYYRGDAFFMQDERPFQILVDCRIIVDITFFYKSNSNYSRPRIIEPVKGSIDLEYLLKGGSNNLIIKPDNVINTGKEPTELKEDELIIYYPTIKDFSFGDKL